MELFKVFWLLSLWIMGGGYATDLQCSAFGPRYDCGYVGIQQDECTSRGCCWIPFEEPGISQPWCFTQNTGPSEYRVSSNMQLAENNGGFNASLQSIESTQPELGPEVADLSLEVDTGLDTVRVKIRDAQNKRFEVPKWVLGEPGDAPASNSKQQLLRVKHTDNPFSFAIARTEGDAQPLFDTAGFRFIFKDQYLELTSTLPKSSTLFGLGERTASKGLPLQRTGIPLTLWNRDRPSEFADENLYGSHPLILELREDGSASGFLLLNSNAMDVVLTEEAISFRIIGGILDFYFFGGPTPAAVIEQFTRLVGRPKLPPFWSLGFHQCKYGYKSVDEVQEVVANYSASGIPLDTMWGDIDYMHQWRDFTLDPANYPRDRMQAFVAGLHQKEMQYVVIVDPGIKAEKGYPAHDRGLAAGVFIKDVTGAPYLGQVWPGPTYYPDFLNPRTQGYWERELRDFHRLLPFDGLWIDMNEAANFCTGEVCTVPPTHKTSPANSSVAGLDEWTDCFLDCGTRSTGAQARLLSPPYAVSNGNALLPLSFRTLPMTATHFDGTLEYNAHNLYGVAECKVTSRALESITGKRSFALTRSSFPGTGAHAAHWTGDNAATWNDLRWSIPGILGSGLSGIPFVGADICGFIGDTNEELCNRWISAGAFYPFSRDHSDLHAGYQELYRWPSVAEAGRKALGLRYRLLPYLYSAFKTAADTGAPVARPLWFNFPADTATHAIDQQWMLGPALLVSPVLAQGASSVQAYFPAGVWYDAFTHAQVRGGQSHSLEAPLGSVPVHFRGGSIVPLQRLGLTSAAVKRSRFTLVVALSALEDLGSQPQRDAVVAEGSLFFDHGEEIQAENSSITLSFTAAVWRDADGLTGKLNISLLHRPLSDLEQCSSVPLPPLEKVVLLGWRYEKDLRHVELHHQISPNHHHHHHLHRQPGILLTGPSTPHPRLRHHQSLQWERNATSGVITIGNMHLDWRCSQSASLSWHTAPESGFAS